MTLEAAAPNDSQAWGRPRFGASLPAGSWARFCGFSIRTPWRRLPTRSLSKKRSHRGNLGFDITLRQNIDSRTNDHHEVHVGREEFRVSTERFAQQPFGAITLHCSTNLTRSDDSQSSWASITPRFEQKQQVPCRNTNALLLNPQKILAPEQAS